MSKPGFIYRDFKRGWWFTNPYQQVLGAAIGFGLEINRIERVGRIRQTVFFEVSGTGQTCFDAFIQWLHGPSARIEYPRQ